MNENRGFDQGDAAALVRWAIATAAFNARSYSAGHLAARASTPREWTAVERDLSAARAGSSTGCVSSAHCTAAAAMRRGAVEDALEALATVDGTDVGTWCELARAARAHDEPDTLTRMNPPQAPHGPTVSRWVDGETARVPVEQVLPPPMDPEDRIKAELKRRFPTATSVVVSVTPMRGVTWPICAQVWDRDTTIEITVRNDSLVTALAALSAVVGMARMEGV